MYQIIRSGDRHHFQNDWLSTYWHFSFADYYDPANVSFGPLRVFNDDTVQPGKGFAAHGHREMEIVTYVLDGELEHRDSTGGHGVIGPGEVQRMTAGTGIRHSEFNASSRHPVHLLQIWILPSLPGLKPGYEQRHFAPEAREGILLPVVTGRHGARLEAPAADGVLTIHQDATFYVSTLRPGKGLVFVTRPERRAYLFVIGGSLDAAGHPLAAGDTARISQETSVALQASETADLLLIDLP